MTRREILRGAAGAALASAASAPAFTRAARDELPELDFASATEVARMLRSRRVGAVELATRMFDRIERLNPRLNAIVNVLRDDALGAARRADQTRGGERGPLHGVPITVKESFQIANVPCTAGIPWLSEYRPTADSEVVRRLRAAGAIVLGNTNVPFFLNDWQTYNPHYGVTNNPWDVTRTPGGSSGGSAAAVAGGLGYLSAGNDRSGSLRIPAHFCGVFSHKPSLNVISLRGWVPSPPGSPPELPETLAVAGPIARTARDLKLAMEVLGGPEGEDALAYRWSMPPPRRKRLQDYRVGFVVDDDACRVDTPVRKCLEGAVDALRAAGVVPREGWPAGIDPQAHHRTYLYLMLAGSRTGLPSLVTSEQLRPLAERDDGSFGSVLAQTKLDPHRRFEDHARQQRAAHDAWRAAFQDIDVFLMPASFVAAFPHDHTDPQTERRLATTAGPRAYMDLIFWNGFANLPGLPSTTAPVGRTAQGLPVGIQVLGPYLEDATPIDFVERMADLIGGFMRPPGFA